MIYSDGHRYHRQLGLVDQSALSNLKVTLTGDEDLIMATLGQLVLAGVGGGENGMIILDVDPNALLGKNKQSWMFTEVNENTGWRDLASLIGRKKGINVSFDDNPDSIKIGLNRGNDSSSGECDLYATAWHGQSIISRKPLIFSIAPDTNPSMIDAALEVATAAAVVNRIFSLSGIIRTHQLSDAWVSLTARIDEMMPEDAVKNFSSIYGEAIGSRLSDGTGSLVRFRIPLDATPNGMFRGILHACDAPENLQDDWVLDLSPFPVVFNEKQVVQPSELVLPARLESAKVLTLGTGGLGSWATPLFSFGVMKEKLSLYLVDADSSVDIHNLNRQVLYTENEIGQAKAPAAAKRLRDILGPKPEIIPIQNRLEERHVPLRKNNGDVVCGSTDSISLEEVVGDGNVIDDLPLTNAIEEMEIAFSCLDNQYARTVLNKCCLLNQVPMINGGGEGFSGVVEVLSDGVCMTCKYGREAAYEKEVISCQETGTRPVASIVTTTAWVGAMQAMLALLKMTDQNGFISSFSWRTGDVTQRLNGSLPWVIGDCLSHI